MIPLGVRTFGSALARPSLRFSAFSLAVTLLIGAPLYRLAFIGYWLWGNLVGPQYGIPTLWNPFDAIGEYPVGAWFHGHMFDAADRHVHASTGDALLWDRVPPRRRPRRSRHCPVLRRRSAS